MTIEIDTTERGFQIGYFCDRNGISCSIQQSSIIGEYEGAITAPGSSALWLGTDELTAPTRMHLAREHVQELVAIMSKWLATGKLEGANE